MSVPYHVSKNQTSGFYEFTTESGIIYEVYFINGEQYFPNELYSSFVKTIGLEKKNGSIPDLIEDGKTRIRKTIEFIIVDLFKSEPETILIYSCAQDDSKQYARCILFDRWFKLFKLDYLVKYDDCIFDEQSPLYYSILFKRDRIHAENIKLKFHQLKNFRNKEMDN